MKEHKQVKFGACLLPFGSETSVLLFAVKNMPIKTYRTISLLAVLHGRESLKFHTMARTHNKGVQEQDNQEIWS
jgi:hypothetical protein